MIRPLNQYVSVKRIVVEEEKSTSGLILSAGKTEKNWGIVTAVSDEIDSIKVGDIVIIAKYGPEKMEVDGEEVTFVEVTDLYAVITKE
jgi:co-chaperonin GroES (HSP10)